MNKISILGLTAACLLLAACQSSSYKISGECAELNDGDTLFVSNDMINGTPTDTMIVKDGKFETEGETDSTYLCMVYSAKQHSINVPFFIEPGSIKLTLSDNPDLSKTSGTMMNRRWQELTDSSATIGKRINKIATILYGTNVNTTEKKRLEAGIELLNKQFAKCVTRFAKGNIDNEFGYFLLTYYPEDIIDNATKLKLINRLPKEMRQRKTIVAMEDSLKRQ